MKYEFRNTNGVNWGKSHIVTAEDLTDAEAVAEVIELTVTEGCTVDGDVTISLRGGSDVTVAVTTDADTPAEVATLIQAETYTGWTATVNGAVVTFTANTAGKKTGANTFDGAETGVEAGIEVKTEGADAVPAKIEFETPELNGKFVCVVSFVGADGALVNFTGTIKVIQDSLTGKAIVEITDNITNSLTAGDVITIIGTVEYN